MARTSKEVLSLLNFKARVENHKVQYMQHKHISIHVILWNYHTQILYDFPHMWNLRNKTDEHKGREGKIR